VKLWSKLDEWGNALMFFEKASEVIYEQEDAFK
jgi:hypothetical protein